MWWRHLTTQKQLIKSVLTTICTTYSLIKPPTSFAFLHCFIDPIFSHSFILSFSYSLSYFSTPSLSPMAKDLQELQESDVIFPDHLHHHHHNDNTCFGYQEMNHHNSRVSSNNNSSKDYNKRMANSLPVNIPVFHHGDNNSFEDDEQEDKEMVPPHVITGRRVAGKMAFSVCTGNGRTLKGRDLSKVRNSILRMTGFLETWPDQLYTHIYVI